MTESNITFGTAKVSINGRDIGYATGVQFRYSDPKANVSEIELTMPAVARPEGTLFYPGPVSISTDWSVSADLDEMRESVRGLIRGLEPEVKPKYRLKE